MIASIIKNGWHAHGFAWAWIPGHMATQSSPGAPGCHPDLEHLFPRSS